jgi:hypothetical protein
MECQAYRPASPSAIKASDCSICSVVATCWLSAVDRLGRNYADVTEVIRQFMKRGIVIRTVINGLVFDGATKDPMQMAVRCCQTKSPLRLVVVASVHEQPVPLFQ